MKVVDQITVRVCGLTKLQRTVLEAAASVIEVGTPGDEVFAHIVRTAVEEVDDVSSSVGLADDENLMHPGFPGDGQCDSRSSTVGPTFLIQPTEAEPPMVEVEPEPPKPQPKAKKPASVKPTKSDSMQLDALTGRAPLKPWNHLFTPSQAIYTIKDAVAGSTVQFSAHEMGIPESMVIAIRQAFGYQIGRLRTMPEFLRNQGYDLLKQRFVARAGL